MPPRIVTARSIGLEFKSNKTPMGPENSTVGHYSAGRRAKNVKEGIALAKAFHLDHQVRLGAAGIGYHFLIPDNGAIICCRSTFFDGAHVFKNNKGRIGVNMPGTLVFKGEPGILETIKDRPTKRQARAFNWLIHNAHTDAMPRLHRTDRDLSKLPIFVHKAITVNPDTGAPEPGRTRCPGLFTRMYKRGGIPWVEPSSDTDEPIDDGFVDLDPEEEQEILAEVAEGMSPSIEGDDPETGPDEEERLLGESDVDGILELPEEDEEFDEDLSELLAEIEAEERQPTA
jgi:hypothetical protein